MSQKSSMLQMLKKLWFFLSLKRRRQLALLLLVMITNSLAEVVSLAAVLPFLVVLQNPSKLLTHPLIAPLAAFLGVNDPQQVLIITTIGFSVAVAGASLTRLLYQFMLLISY